MAKYEVNDPATRDQIVSYLDSAGVRLPEDAEISITVKGSKSGVPQACEDGCGGQTQGGNFLPGHDAKLKAGLYAVIRGRPSDVPEGVHRTDNMTPEQATDVLRTYGWPDPAASAKLSDEEKAARKAQREKERDERRAVKDAERKAAQEKKNAEKIAAKEKRDAEKAAEKERKDAEKAAEKERQAAEAEQAKEAEPTTESLAENLPKTGTTSTKRGRRSAAQAAEEAAASV